MLEPRKVFTSKTGTGFSEVFTAQWYPKVTVQIKRTDGTAHSAQLQGSLDKTNWVDVGSAITGAFGNSDVWFLWWRLNLTSNDGTIDAWIGAGGA